MQLPSYYDVISMFDSGAISSLDWRQLCYNKESPIFELFTMEFVNLLAEYLSQRVEAYYAMQKQQVLILEIGAGDGRLTHFLRLRLYTLIPGKVQIVATDSGLWKSIRPVFPVESLDYRKALKIYQPGIVLCSWMMYQRDWTAAIRAIPSVNEYVLIGEMDEGCCGHPYRTWGLSSFRDREISDKKDGNFTPLYEMNGFQRYNLDEISRYQICRSDWPDSRFHSKTVSFLRETKT